MKNSADKPSASSGPENKPPGITTRDLLKYAGAIVTAAVLPSWAESQVKPERKPGIYDNPKTGERDIVIGTGVAPIWISPEAMKKIDTIKNTKTGAYTLKFNYAAYKTGEPQEVSFGWDAGSGWGQIEAYYLYLRGNIVPIEMNIDREHAEMRVILVGDNIYVCRIPKEDKSALLDPQYKITHINHAARSNTDRYRDLYPNSPDYKHIVQLLQQQRR